MNQTIHSNLCLDGTILAQPIKDPITDVVENLAETVNDHWGPGDFTISIAVRPRIYELRLYRFDPKTSRERVLTRQVERPKLGDFYGVDPIALEIEKMCEVIQAESEPPERGID